MLQLDGVKTQGWENEEGSVAICGSWMRVG